MYYRKPSMLPTRVIDMYQSYFQEVMMMMMMKIGGVWIDSFIIASFQHGRYNFGSNIPYNY
jgi:hypothetical protein